MIYRCCTDERSRAVMKSTINGIDFLEVLETAKGHSPGVGAEGDGNGRRIRLHFLKPLSGSPLEEVGVSIRGDGNEGEVTSVWRLDEDPAVLEGMIEGEAGFGSYILRLVRPHEEHLGEDEQQCPAGYDPILSSVSFRLRPGCDIGIDCEANAGCMPQSKDEPEINYLAKDYSGFRQAILDRMSLLMPQWKERSPLDQGVVMAELLAYIGDYLSYRQDAVATEAYLDTARLRTSVRRHARLVDYRMHDGCNSRVWVQIAVKEDVVSLYDDDGRVIRPAIPKGTRLLSLVKDAPTVIPDDESEIDRMLAESSAVFETMEDAGQLLAVHNAMDFYTWGAKECCLPRGATTAFLEGDRTTLRKGDVLIFEEVKGPLTGRAEDANPANRHAVRLTQDPKLLVDPLGDLLQRDSPAAGEPAGSAETNEVADFHVTKIEWGGEDALPFPLCISGRIQGSSGRSRYNQGVSVAHGNIVPCDHGMTMKREFDPSVEIPSAVLARVKALGLTKEHLEPLGSPPYPTLYLSDDPKASRCGLQRPRPVRPRFRPSLTFGPITRVSLSSWIDPSSGEQTAIDVGSSASSAMTCDPRTAIPVIRVVDERGRIWKPVPDLLASDSLAREFVLESEEGRFAYIRFGDGVYGLAPTAGERLFAFYRIGNGSAGNLGRDTLRHIISGEDSILAVRNPLPAAGGTDEETLDEVRTNAPHALHWQERAVTAMDYAVMAERHPQVQRASAAVRWNGSWETVCITVDRLGGLDIDSEFKRSLLEHLEKYRMAGHDLQIEEPSLVPLEIEMNVTLMDGYHRGDVEREIMMLFSGKDRSDGRTGLFHPDNLSFGEPVYLSKLYQAARSVQGVAVVEITKFGRLGDDALNQAVPDVIRFGSTEIALMDNSPDRPDRGLMRLYVKEGV